MTQAPPPPSRADLRAALATLDRVHKDTADSLTVMLSWGQRVPGEGAGQPLERGEVPAFAPLVARTEELRQAPLARPAPAPLPGHRRLVLMEALATIHAGLAARDLLTATGLEVRFHSISEAPTPGGQARGAQFVLTAGRYRISAARTPRIRGIQRTLPDFLDRLDAARAHAGPIGAGPPGLWQITARKRETAFLPAFSAPDAVWLWAALAGRTPTEQAKWTSLPDAILSVALHVPRIHWAVDSRPSA